MPPAATTGLRRHGVEHLWQERHRADSARVTAGLVTLSHDDVSVAVADAAGVLDVAHQRYHLAARLMDLVDERRRIAQTGCEHWNLHARDCVHLILRREARDTDIGARRLDIGQVEVGANLADHLSLLIRQQVTRILRSLTAAWPPRNVRRHQDVDAERPVGEVLDAPDLRFQAIRRESGCAEDAEPARVGDGSHQLRAGDAGLAASSRRSHARQRDWIFDVEQIAHLGVKDWTCHELPVCCNAECVRTEVVLPVTIGVRFHMQSALF